MDIMVIRSRRPLLELCRKLYRLNWQQLTILFVIAIQSDT